MRSYFPIVLGCVLISGCVTTPQFEKISGVTPKSVVDVIACELIETRDRICRDIRKQGKLRSGTRDPCDDRDDGKKLKDVRTKDGKPLANLAEWIAVADLTLTVDEQAALAPAFAHADVVSKSLTRAFDWGVKYSTEAQRSYTELITFKIKSLTKREGGCDEPPTRILLNGNLGLGEVVELAFGSIDSYDTGIGFSGAEDTASRTKQRDRGSVDRRKHPAKTLYRAERDGGGRAGQRNGGKASERDGGGGKKEGPFGTSIEFVVTKSLNATGPTWTLAHFKGPGKLFTGESQNTHKLRISFGKEKPDTRDRSGTAAAEDEAKGVNYRLLFESLGSKVFKQSQ